jgi:hypothetical protein
VVDTNVLVHASNPDEPLYFEDSVAFLARLIDTALCIGVDPGFALDETNRSLVGDEYRKWVVNQPPGSLGREILFQLWTTQRVVETSLKVSPDIHKRVLSFIKGAKPRDRTFLKLAYKTLRQELVTHDFEDFQKDKRRTIKAKLGVVVCTGADWQP